MAIRGAEEHANDVQRTLNNISSPAAIPIVSRRTAARPPGKRCRARVPCDSMYAAHDGGVDQGKAKLFDSFSLPDSGKSAGKAKDARIVFHKKMSLRLLDVLLQR